MSLSHSHGPSFHQINRRRLLQGLTLSSGLFAVSTGILSGPRQAIAGEDNTATPTKLKWSRVKTIIELKGEVRLPDRKAVVKGAIKSAPVESVSTLEYEENYVPYSEDRSGLVSYQRILEATVENRINKQAIDQKLRPECYDIVRFLNGELLTTNSVEGNLTPSERDLVEGPIASLFLDEILPGKSVRMGDAWSPENDVLRRLFQMDSIKESTLKIKLVDANESKGQLDLEGKIQGRTHDVETTLTIQGKAQVDRKIGMITWLAASIEETRDVGEGEPGFQISARVRILRSPLAQPTATESLATIQERAIDPESAKMLHFRLDKGGYQFLADEHWHVMSDGTDQSILRFVKKNKSIVHCSIKNLVNMEAGQQLTLEGFQEDVRRSLGTNFGEFLESSERTTRNGLRHLQVTSGGTVEGVVVQWISNHLSDDSGRRVNITFTMDASVLETFDGSDQQIVGGLEFLDRTAKKDGSETQLSSKGTPTSR